MKDEGRDSARRRPPLLDWVTVPAGPFTMGAAGAPGPADAPPHRLDLPAFWMARTQVTNRQYAAFTAATGRPPPAHWEGTAPPVELADHPVTYVDWHDAAAFCAWAGGRLPSEAEWEKAARGDDGRAYPWGDAAPTPQRCNFGGQLGATTPAGSYPAGASPYGLLDMAGNVWEWTATLHRPYPYRGGDGREDPATPGRRVLRGGSYQHSATGVRCAARGQLHPGARDVYIGFRVVATGALPTPGLEWVYVPAGPFLMGEVPAASAPTEALPAPGAPAHRLDLGPFALTRTPITNAQYAAFTAATGRRPPAHWEGATPPVELADHPVTYVDWHDAVAFCAWAGGRLPSEAEWEKAARGPDARLYPWGETAPDAARACFDRADDPLGTWPVGCCPAGASPYGLLDMAGNVWEWTATLHRPYPYRADDGREDPATPGRRVLRGGSCRSEQAHYLRCAFRSLSYPARRRDHIGFRAARTLPPAKGGNHG